MLPKMLTRRDVLALGATLLGGAARREYRWPAAQSTARTSFVPDVELVLIAAPGEARILPGRATAVWRFTGSVIKGPATALEVVPGSYLGPTIRLQRGQRVRIRFSNRLPDPTIVHWHGLDVPAAADGHPRLAVAGGAVYVYEFEVTNRAGTYWYHPHPHMQTGPQVYSGLAGLLVVTDPEEAALTLPSGAEELLCVLQDRRFDRDNQLVYSTTMMDMETGFLGDQVLVNGRAHPEWSLATRAYRVRILNGSNARIYKLTWSDKTPMTVLGTDGGLLERPQTRPAVTLAPGQRTDLWLDLSQRALGGTFELRSAAFALSDAGLDMGGMRGMGMGMGGVSTGGRGAAMATGGPLALGAPISLAGITIARKADAPARLPARLSTIAPASQPSANTPVRQVPLTFRMMQWLLAGKPFEMADVAADETVKAGSTHIWEFVNGPGPMGMQMAHPIHIHGRQFRVLGRSGGSPANSLRDGLVDDGLQDTVLVLPNETVRVQVTFSAHPGLYLYHCHILEHEDMGMMRNFRVVPD